MKKHFLLFTALMALALAGFSQGHVYRTTEYVGNIPQSDEFAIDMCKDSDGNMYAIGKTYNGSNFDISISKFDILGNHLWEQTYNNGGNDYPLHVEIGESGNVYVSGNADVSSTPKGLLLKYDPTGTLLWDTHVGGIGGSTILDSETQTLGGSTYLVGSFKSSLTEQKATIYRIGSDGVEDWSASYDYSTSGDEDDEFSSITLNPYNGDVYVGGLANNGTILLVKYNSSGTQQWVKTPRNGKVLDLASEGNSYNYYVYLVAQTSVTFPDAYTAKYNSDGVLEWENTFTDGALNGPAEIHYYNSNIYTAFRHNAGSGTPTRNDYITKYNTDGTEQWVIDNYYIGFSVPGEFSVSDNAQLLSFDGDYLYCVEDNKVIWKYSLTDPINDLDVYSPTAMPEYQTLREVPDEVMPIKSFINNNIVYFLGDAKFNSNDNSRIGLSSFCLPVTDVIIDAPTNVCGNSIQLNANNAGNPHWLESVISGGSITSFSDNFIVNPTVDVSYSTEMTINLQIRAEDANTCPTYATQDITFNKKPTTVITGDLSYCEGSSTTLDAGAGYDDYIWSNGDNSQTSTITSAGTYSVEVTDANSCTSLPVSVDVTEIELTTVLLGADKEICEGETVVLDAGSFDSYNWSTGESSQSINVSTSGQIILEVSNAGYCDNSDTLMVTVNDLPTVDLGIDQTACNGDIITLDAGVLENYLWSTGATSQTIDVSTTGDYILEVTDANSCSNSDTIHVQFDDCTGINQTANNTISVYPNPAHNKLTINNTQLLVNNVEIMDITGKTIKQFSVNTKTVSVDISDLKNGIYFIKLKGVNTYQTLKLVKK